MANTEHNPTPSQINIKCHSKSLITSMTITQYIMSSFQQKIMRHTKKKKTQFENTDQASEPD